MSLRFRDRDGGGLRRWVGENDGGGEKKTLRLVARYADACNLFATDAAVVAHKLSVLDRHCEAEARDPATIERTIITAADPLARVLRLGPDGWAPVPIPRQVSDVEALAALPDGGILVLANATAWWVTRDGRVAGRRALPTGLNGRDEFMQSVTWLPDGGFVAGSVGGETYALMVQGTGPVRRLVRLDGDDVGFSGLPDGSLLAARGPVIRVLPNAERRSLFGARPELGPGDGGPARAALLAGAGVSAGPPGAVLVAEPNGPRHDMPLTLDASWVSGRTVTDVFSLPEGRQSGAVRWIGAPPPGRLLAAIAPPVYHRLASGHVPVTTTLGGGVRVVVRSARRVVVDRRVTIGPGDSEVSLGRRLSQGDYRITLTVKNGPQIATHRVGVSTLQVLPLRRAIRAIQTAVDSEGDGDGGGGYLLRATECRRVAARHIRCWYIGVSYSDDDSTTRCLGTISAHLRADGLRIVRRGAPCHHGSPGR